MSINPGNGFRLVPVGERIYFGDEVFLGIAWFQTWYPGQRVPPGATYRRRIEL